MISRAYFGKNKQSVYACLGFLNDLYLPLDGFILILNIL